MLSHHTRESPTSWQRICSQWLTWIVFIRASNRICFETENENKLFILDESRLPFPFFFIWCVMNSTLATNILRITWHPCNILLRCSQMNMSLQSDAPLCFLFIFCVDHQHSRESFSHRECPHRYPLHTHANYGWPGTQPGCQQVDPRVSCYTHFFSVCSSTYTFSHTHTTALFARVHTHHCSVLLHIIIVVKSYFIWSFSRTWQEFK